MALILLFEEYQVCRCFQTIEIYQKSCYNNYNIVIALRFLLLCSPAWTELKSTANHNANATRSF